MARDEASTPGPDKGAVPAEEERAHGTKRFYGAVKVGARGQIVLPAEARSDFAIAAGARLLVFGDLEQGLWIAPVDVLQRTMEGTTAFYRMIAPAMGDAGANGGPRRGRNDAGGEADGRGGDVDSMAAKNDADHDREGGDREGQHAGPEDQHAEPGAEPEGQRGEPEVQHAERGVGPEDRPAKPEDQHTGPEDQPAKPEDQRTGPEGTRHD